MADESFLSRLGLKSVRLEPPEQRLLNENVFPLIVSPGTVPGGLDDIETVGKWIKSNKTELEDLLYKHGAVLFRGFPLDSPNHFDQVVKSFGYKPVPYLGGAAPRKHVTGDVFTANEAPPEEVIYFHNEMAYLPISPDVLFFYCDVPPASQGETPVVLSRIIYEELLVKEPDFLKQVEEKGVYYSRVLPNQDDEQSSIGTGWQRSFQVTTKAELEKKIEELYSRADWLDDGSLKVTSDIKEAVRVDKRSGKKCWFNTIISAYRNWKDSRNKAEDNVCFGDGSPMNPAVMGRLETIMNNHKACFHWRRGDVLMIDNLLVLHGRNFFSPPRRILASLCAR